MKTLGSLRLHHLEEINDGELRLIKGGKFDPIYVGGTLGEVEVYANRPFVPSLYIWDILGSKDLDKLIGSNSVGLAPIPPTHGGNPNQNKDNPFEGGDPTNPRKDTKDATGTKYSNSAMLLAADILDNSNISPAKGHYSKVVDKASAEQNLMDASKGLLVHTSDYGKAPGLMVALSPALMAGVLALAQKYKISISEIAGGDHSANSSHYKGLSIDVNIVNGDHVDIRNISDDEIIAFRNAAYAAGATKVLDPLNEPVHHFNHFHIQW